MRKNPKFVMGITSLALLILTGGFAQAQQAVATDSILGTWLLVSEIGHQGEKTTEPLGHNPIGSIMFGQDGRCMLMIARQGIPKFVANKRDAGTPEENKAVLSGTLSFFGTYSYDETEKILKMHVEGSTFPNWIGSDQKRICTLSGDEMKWKNLAPAVGAEYVELVWKKAS